MNQNKELDKIKKLINKVFELSEKGIDGERDSAKKKLEQLLKKHDLTLDDILGESVEMKCFRVDNTEESVSILSHIIWKIAGINTEIQKHSKKHEVYCGISNSDYLQIKLMFEFYYNSWLKEKKELSIAFILGNNLGVDSGHGNTDVDSETLKSIAKKMDSVNKKNYINGTKLIKQ